jgi:hypothetical protein
VEGAAHTNALERINGEFRRRTKTQASLPSSDAVLLLLFGLLRSGAMKLRRMDGWDEMTRLEEERKSAQSAHAGADVTHFPPIARHDLEQRLHVGLPYVGQLEPAEGRQDPLPQVRLESCARARPPTPRLLGFQARIGDLGHRIPEAPPGALGLRVHALVDFADDGLRPLAGLRESDLGIRSRRQNRSRLQYWSPAPGPDDGRSRQGGSLSSAEPNDRMEVGSVHTDAAHANVEGLVLVRARCRRR